MSDYIHHTANTIDVAAGPLPKVWQNVSGLNLLSDVELKPLGWLPVVYSGSVPAAYRGVTTGVQVGDSVTPDADDVTGTYAYKSTSNCKSIRKAAIDAKRDALLVTGKTINGNTYDGRLTTMGAIVAKRDRTSRRGGAAVKNISGINTSTGTVTITGGAPEDGNEVQFASVGGTTELNGNVYFSANKSGNNFTLIDRIGNAVDMSGFGSYTSGGTATVVVTAIGVDNSLIALNFGDFEAMADELSQWHNNMYEQARAYKNAVDALSTAAAVASHTDGDDNGDWPS